MTTRDVTLDAYKSYVLDPSKLLDDIDAQLEDADVDELPLGLLDADNGAERGIQNGRPKHSVVERILASSEGAIRTACCERGRYCEVRSRHADTVGLIQAVVDGLVSAHIKLPLPLGTLGAYCVLSLFLDRVCNCAES